MSGRARAIGAGSIVGACALLACHRGAAGAGDTDEERNHPLVGVSSPRIALATVNDLGRFDLASARGKVAIVDFWATWCASCAVSFPKFAELQAKYASDLTTVGVSEDDDREGIAEFAHTYGANFPVVWDERKRIAAAWSPRKLPATFIVDRAGIVRFVHIGYHDGEETEIERELKGLL